MVSRKEAKVGLKKEVRLPSFQRHTKVNDDDDGDDNPKRTGEIRIAIKTVYMEQLAYSFMGTMSKSKTISLGIVQMRKY